MRLVFLVPGWVPSGFQESAMSRARMEEIMVFISISLVKEEEEAISYKSAKEFLYCVKSLGVNAGSPPRYLYFRYIFAAVGPSK